MRALSANQKGNNTMAEEWRDIIGFEGFYQVSNLGRVKRIKSGSGTQPERILRPRINRGYYRVNLSKNNHPFDKRIHRLVAEAFIPNPENKPEVDHIDGNVQNNNVDNLRWVTPKENMQNEKTKDVLCHRKKRYGEKNHSSIPIICEELQTLFWGANEAQRVTGIWQQSICKVLKGKRNTAGGFHWRYATESEIANA